MGLMFGTQDEIDCLTNTTFEGPHGDQLCLASHISLHFVAAGVYVSDGGYVLKVKGVGSYYKVDAEQLKALQAEGTLPTPLPPYHVSIWQYAIGYSLWIVIGVIVLAALFKKVFGKMDPFLRADVAPVIGPPVARTEHDRWLTAEFSKHLAPGERLQHQAFAHNAPANSGVKLKGLFVALTDRRLLVMEAFYGFSGLKREVGALVDRPRSEITGVQRDVLTVGLQFGEETVYFYVVASQRKLTNQWLFARDVPRLLAAAPQPQVQTPVQTVNAPA